MGDPGPSESWKKLVISKTDDQWVSSTKTDSVHEVPSVNNVIKGLDFNSTNVKSEIVDVEYSANWQSEDVFVSIPQIDPLSSGRKKGETTEDRAARLARMSAYAATRLANESPDQRASRLKRMSEYAAKRLANETSEQRAKRLARMSAYAAKRLAQETPQQRKDRLARMSAYAAKRQAMKKKNNTNSINKSFLDDQVDRADL